MGNIFSPLSVFALAAAGVAIGLPLEEAGPLESRQRDGGNGQGDIIKRIVTAFFLGLTMLLALYIYVTWKLKGPARPRPSFLPPPLLYVDGEAPMAVMSRQPSSPRSKSVFSTSSSQTHLVPPIRIPVKAVKAKTKINAPAVGDHYMNK